jgi:tRNA(adenine34) deaminase
LDTDLNNINWMKLAITQAELAAERGEVPIGAVLIDNKNQLLASDGNRCIELSDPTAHAEILVLRQAGNKLGNYRLTETSLFVTLEPCVMCTGALVQARIQRLIYGAFDVKGGAIDSCYQINRDRKLNHNFHVTQGVLQEQSSKLLKIFFKNRRTKIKKNRP